MSLLIPKPTPRKKLKAKKDRGRYKRRSAFHNAVKELSGGRCENPYCMAVCDFIGAHHIEAKRPNAPHLDTPENGIYLCGRVGLDVGSCHHKAENGGYDYHLKRYVTATEYMIGILEALSTRKGFRHSEALANLKKKIVR